MTPFSVQANYNSEDWITPKYILDALGCPFDLDPCAAAGQPWRTAKRHYTKRGDGLRRKWFGRIWLNPPYGRQTAKWMKKMADHANGIALIFARTDTDMFHEYVLKRASFVFFLRGRIKFCRPDGLTAKHNCGAPSCLVAYGVRNAKYIQRSGLPGYAIPMFLLNSGTRLRVK